MRAMVLERAEGMECLRVVDRPVPDPGPGQVLVRIKAVSLNYRDLLVLEGGYGSHQKSADLIPIGDGAGEVVAFGPGVTRFAAGDRVLTNPIPAWISGELTAEKLATNLGAKLDGVLCEYRLFDPEWLVRPPPHLSDVEAAALPIAGLTAWSAVVTNGKAAPGDVVLVQGTGGVALFALQFAKLCGAEVIVTSSSEAKLDRAKTLSADRFINYKEDPGWGKTAREMTGGVGVNNVIEVGGAATLKESLRAVRFGGMISLIGVLSGANHELALPLVLMRNVHIRGVASGSRETMEAMIQAISFRGLRPVVDRVFPFEETKTALQYLASGRHFGKVCLNLDAAAG